jgi:hypothetical protein
VCSIARVSTGALRHCETRSNTATRSVTRRTSRRHHRRPSTSTFPTRWWGVTMRLLLREGHRPRSPHRGVHSRRRGRYPPPGLRPRSPRPRWQRLKRRNGSGPGIDVEEGDTESPGATAAPSTGTPRRAASTEEQAVETPRQMSATEERPRSSADIVGDLGLHKRVRKAPPKPCKPDLRSATK